MCTPLQSDYDRFRCTDDTFFTLTSTEQKRVEDNVSSCFKLYKELVSVDPCQPQLLRELHAAYLRKGLNAVLPKSHQALDSSRPWICYWILHALELLDEPISDVIAKNVVTFLKTCKTQQGGYGGGPGQLAHLATTYASIMALSIVGTDEAYESIDRRHLLAFLTSLKQPSGSFVMHTGGEVDIRAAYCSAAIAALLELPTVPLFDGTPEWLAACQTYEGGFGAEPGAEAHGGYTYCGITTLTLLGHERLCYLDSLKRWLAWKQMRYEGGYQGRTNKLVDGCYSFWQAACWPIISQIDVTQNSPTDATVRPDAKPDTNPDTTDSKPENSTSAPAQNGTTTAGVGRQRDRRSFSEQYSAQYFDTDALQHYVLVCCQSPTGGLIDKPGNSRDYYHTCYTLSGLSIAQHSALENGKTKKEIVGGADNLLERNHPFFNVCVSTERKTRSYWAKVKLEL